MNVLRSAKTKPAMVNKIIIEYKFGKPNVAVNVYKKKNIT
jgi:hypothetical protein